MTNNFLRQRRNLFITNGIFLFSFFVKVDISKLTLLGISFNGFDNPLAVYYFLWVILAYFFYRFILFFIEDEWSDFYKRWGDLMGVYTDKKLQLMARKHSGDKLDGHDMSTYYRVKNNNWKLTYHEQFKSETFDPIDNAYNTVVKTIELPISRLNLLFPQLKAIFVFCLFTSALTNYLLPFILSLFVFFFIGLSSWEGSICTMISNF